MHLVEEQIQRILHGELIGSAATEIQHHLATCSDCRDRVSQAKREDQWVLERLVALDHPPPPLRAADMVGASYRRTPGWGRWAAGIFLAAAVAGAAYAAPGSPLPNVLARLFQADRSSAAPTRPIESDGEFAPSGVAVSPGRRLTISFSTVGVGDTAVVSVSAGSDVVIRARGGSTSFTSDPERLEIIHRGNPGRFEILIPRMAPRVELQVRGRRLLLKEGSRVSTRVPADSGGQYLIALMTTE